MPGLTKNKALTVLFIGAIHEDSKLKKARMDLKLVKRKNFESMLIVCIEEILN